MGIKINIFLLLILTIGCRDENQSFSKIINQLKSNISVDETSKLKNLHFEEVFQYIELDSIIYTFYYNNQEVYFNEFFSSLGVEANDGYRVDFLMLALYYEVIDKKLELKSMLKEVDEFYHEQWIKHDSEFILYDSISRKIMLINRSTIDLGDTIRIVLPVEKKRGQNKIFYYYGYPYSQTYKYANDSVQISGVVLGEHSYESQSNDLLNYILDYKVIKIDNDSIFTGTGIIKNGDVLELDLMSYGRLIK